VPHHQQSENVNPPTTSPVGKRRSIRGADSIIERVNQQLSECETIVNELENEFSINGQDVFSFLSEMAQIAAAAEQTIEPLIELESDIQLLKDEFPGYDGLLEIDDRVSFLYQQGNETEAKQIEHNHSQDLKLFRRRRNEIEERIFIAREYRLAFLSQQRRLSMLQHSLARHQIVSKTDALRLNIAANAERQTKFQEQIKWLESCSKISPYLPQVIDENQSIENQIHLLQSDIDALESEIQTFRQTFLPALKRIGPILQTTAP
ncbi:hypothetical protein K8I31_14875, partial [bacterium]|nr:hypothetical protein [bacterium]